MQKVENFSPWLQPWERHERIVNGNGFIRFSPGLERTSKKTKTAKAVSSFVPGIVPTAEAMG